MLMVADPAGWFSDPEDGLTRYTVPITAGTARAVLSVSCRASDGVSAAVDVECPSLTAEPVVRELPGTIVVDCAVSSREATYATLILPERPSRMTARLFDEHHGLVGWSLLFPAALAHPRPRKTAFSHLDIGAMAAQLGRGEIDQVLDELSYSWAGIDLADRSAATAALFRCLAEHPLKRSAVLGALMASLCNFRVST